MNMKEFKSKKGDNETTQTRILSHNFAFRLRY